MARVDGSASGDDVVDREDGVGDMFVRLVRPILMRVRTSAVVWQRRKWARRGRGAGDDDKNQCGFAAGVGGSRVTVTNAS